MGISRSNKNVLGAVTVPQQRLQAFSARKCGGLACPIQTAPVGFVSYALTFCRVFVSVVQDNVVKRLCRFMLSITASKKLSHIGSRARGQ